jgi:hypothetical protein
MFYSRNLLSGKRKYLLELILFLLTSVICTAYSMERSDDLSNGRWCYHRTI